MPLIIYRGWFVYTVITIPIHAAAAFVKQLIFQGLLWYMKTLPLYYLLSKG